MGNQDEDRRFCPIGNNGWLLSENAPQYKPTFELNKQIVQRAEHYGFDFALSMIKLRGFGGKLSFGTITLKHLPSWQVSLLSPVKSKFMQPLQH